ncbi:tetraacyldisaccharide 4'-kinase [Campylobacter concisus]|uniref:tetraacyldisaccharide 4'-kinase n=1 Tax=Campylobacter concisus TaxID=199 RepID=UPI000B3D5E4A|nr:tetraacyldisaccharide 4'-kinase [Campylobacter concisus]OUT13701.1 tetraacyldisaccharide 4'-kinase [Campylobacter concisus]
MFKKLNIFLHAWANEYFFRPNFFQILLAFLLLPLSFIYFLIVIFKKFTARKIDFGIKIISVGNLTLGGSGKTPLCVAIAKNFEGAFIILRGYKRKSKGMQVVARDGKILLDVAASGDEAMIYATSLKNANVIVSEDRKVAIKYAKEHGAKYVLLDDGFSKFDIAKFDILVRPNPEPRLKFCLPSGAYRYPFSFYKFGDFIAIEGQTHFRKSEILNKSEKMVLVTAIANPERLKPFFDECVAQVFFPDHYDFSKDELEEILKRYGATSLLMTQKDYVKAKDFGLRVSLITLEVTLSEEFKKVLAKQI